MEQEQLSTQEDIMAITIELDSGGYVENWGTYTGGKPNPGAYVIGLHKDHQFFTDMRIGSYKYDMENNNFIHDPERVLILQKRTKISDLSRECETRILAGFEYIYKEAVYHISYDKEAQNNFETTKELFNHNLLTTIAWSVTFNNTKTTLELSKADFTQLYVYSSLIKQYKLTHYREHLIPAINELPTAESVEIFNWDSVTPSPLPDIPEIDTNGDGEVSQEEFDQLLAKSKELEQELAQANESAQTALARSEQTESVLLDAITLIFDSMPM